MHFFEVSDTGYEEGFVDLGELERLVWSEPPVASRLQGAPGKPALLSSEVEPSCSNQEKVFLKVGKTIITCFFLIRKNDHHMYFTFSKRL